MTPQDTRPLAARVYILDARRQFHFVPSTPGQSVAKYDTTDAGTGIREAYSLVGAGEFGLELPAGTYEFTVERGKEYLPLRESLTITEGQTLSHVFRLERFCDMAGRGWYSGDCHVHTRLRDLPLAQLADDLNVAFPITARTTSIEEPPELISSERPLTPGALVNIDPTHVYWTLNTEYEVIKGSGQRWTSGSMLILAHHQPFTQTAPPFANVVHEARAQNAILDWEKHTWPWSTMLVPVAGVDTIELSNNSMWRERVVTSYLWGRRPPPWIATPLDARGFVDYGFESYYALLNCGFNLRPSAGTANGVHPVSVGHSRVYVHVNGEFSYQKWLDGLRAGRSFATNGPLIFLSVDGLEPGGHRSLTGGGSTQVLVSIETYSAKPMASVELIVNGRATKVTDEHAARALPANQSREGIPAEEGARKDSRTSDRPIRVADENAMPADGPHHRHYKLPITISGSSWVAARCFEESSADNPHFAHTGPIFFDDPAHPLRPEPRQIRYLIDATADQLERNRGHISEPALAEYRQALNVYRRIAEAAGVKERSTSRMNPALELKPSSENPRNSEGSFVTLKDGHILFVYSHFTGGSADDAAAHLACCLSEDEGKTWTESRELATDPSASNNMSVSLLRLQNGSIALFYMSKHSPTDCRPQMIISTDEAKTWTEPAYVIPNAETAYYVLNNDRVVQLKSGRLIAPVSLHRLPGKPWNADGTIMCYLSDDSGKSWRRSEWQSGTPRTLQEPGIMEKVNGDLLLFCRTKLGSQHLCESSDSGETWSAFKPSSIISPQSPASIKRIPTTGDWLLLYNHHFDEKHPGGGRRTPLCSAISRDEGQTWTNERVLEDNPDGWFCYTAIHFVGDHVLLAYCAGDRRENNGLALTKIVCVPVALFYEKQSATSSAE